MEGKTSSAYALLGGGIASASMTVFTGLRDYIAATGTSAVSRLASMR
jgi:hypothetical protein